MNKSKSISGREFLYISASIFIDCNLFIHKFSSISNVIIILLPSDFEEIIFIFAEDITLHNKKSTNKVILIIFVIYTVKIKFFNTYINITNIEEQKKALFNCLQNNNKAVFYYLNSYSFYLTEKSPSFRKAFNAADYITADGMSIVWGIKLLHKNIEIEKATPNRMFIDYWLLELSKIDAPIYFLGSNETNVSKAANKLSYKFRRLRISGYYHGYFEEHESKNIIDKINSAKPKILVVGMGMPKSELWIQKNYELFGDYIIMTVGNLIDIFAGEVKIAPKFLYSSGFEWVYRLLKEPRRLFKRYMLANSYTIYKIFSKKIL